MFQAIVNRGGLGAGRAGVAVETAVLVALHNALGVHTRNGVAHGVIGELVKVGNGVQRVQNRRTRKFHAFRLQQIVNYPRHLVTVHLLCHADVDTVEQTVFTGYPFGGGVPLDSNGVVGVNPA